MPDMLARNQKKRKEWEKQKAKEAVNNNSPSRVAQETGHTCIAENTGYVKIQKDGNDVNTGAEGLKGSGPVEARYTGTIDISGNGSNVNSGARTGRGPSVEDQ
ncbi:hypothetical protein MGN70_007534 [Eutypa lata]|nr:hypothetical protein MGN70_007534 [Eutypa lata]